MFYSTAQKMKFSINNFFSKCGQILSFLRIWSHLLKKSLMENLFFVQFNIRQKFPLIHRHSFLVKKNEIISSYYIVKTENGSLWC